MRADLSPCADVLVLGAGPAGAAIASQLAREHDVLLVDARAGASRRIGECLPGAAHGALRELGVWPAFEAQAHRPAWWRLACWGDDGIVAHDGLADPHGPGWHVDRAAFEALLVDQSRANGARVMRPARVHGLERVADDARHPWRVVLDTAAGSTVLRCRFLVDASGRAGHVARRTGVGLVRADRLLCLHLWLQPRDGAGAASLLEAARDGWWYSAAMPDGSRLVAWYTDADLADARTARDAHALLARACATRLLAPCCEGARAVGPLLAAPAHGQWPRAAAGPDWLAVGDASLAVDPLASQGLLHGLVTACEGARAVAAMLEGDAAAAAAWVAQLRALRERYCAQSQAYYAQERRWPDAPFWQRRRKASPAAPASTAVSSEAPARAHVEH